MTDRNFHHFLVQHQVEHGQIIANFFKTKAEAEQWVMFLLNHTNIPKVELIGVVEEQYVLNGWCKNND